MKLSIITVNLNNVSGLKKTIDSVVSQTYRDFEWIVIDGGSTDGSRELIEEYSSYFAYWVSEPDKGIYNAMNKGVAHAGGEYCQFLNSGDWLASSTILEEVFECNYTQDVIYGDLDWYKSGNYIFQSKFPDIITPEDLFYGSLGHNSSFIRLEIQKSFPYDEHLKIASDSKLFLLMLLQKKTFVHFGHSVTCFDMNGISQTNHTLWEYERKQVLAELSDLLIQREIELTTVTAYHLANTSLEWFCRLCDQHPFLSKIITATILLMKRMR